MVEEIRLISQAMTSVPAATPRNWNNSWQYPSNELLEAAF
jgi:hypothetical protein